MHLESPDGADPYKNGLAAVLLVGGGSVPRSLGLRLRCVRLLVDVCRLESETCVERWRRGFRPAPRHLGIHEPNSSDGLWPTEPARQRDAPVRSAPDHGIVRHAGPAPAWRDAHPARNSPSTQYAPVSSKLPTNTSNPIPNAHKSTSRRRIPVLKGPHKPAQGIALGSLIAQCPAPSNPTGSGTRFV